MMSTGFLWPGLGGFLVGAACMRGHARRGRAELSAFRWAAEHDSLTGLPNRAGIRRRYEAARSTGHPPTAVLLDLNGFKQVNDTYGHQAGDRLLSEVAHRLAEGCRPVGSAGRLGGDEFLLLLPHATPTEAAPLVQSLLTRIAQPITADADARPPVVLTASASAGIAPPQPGCSWPAQLRQADIALYHAKKHPGGIVSFREGMEHPPCTPGGRRRLETATCGSPGF